MEALAKLGGATRALAEAKTLGEVAQIRDIAEAARTYARAAKLGLEAQNHATEIKLRAERKAGELLSELDKGQGGRPLQTPDSVSAVSEYRCTIEAAEVTERMAQRWQEVSKIPESMFEKYIDVTQKHQEELSTAGVLRYNNNMPKVVVAGAPHVSNNSGDNEWYTPPQYIEAAHEVMGWIDLDPASSAIANATVRAGCFFTAEDDGLGKAWWGNVWMNPPYARDLIAQFCAKLVKHYRAGDVGQAIVLVNNATDTQWFQELGCVASAAVFPRGRVRFHKSDGEVGAPLQGQAILYLGSEWERFLDVYSIFGIGAILGGDSELSS